MPEIRLSFDAADYTVLREQAEKLGLTAPQFAAAAALREAKRLAAGHPATATAADLPPVRDAGVDAIRATERRIDAALARVPRQTDATIADQLGLTVDVVRRHREGQGIAGVAQPLARSGWEDALLACHARGLTRAEIAAELGWTPGTVSTRLSALRKADLLPTTSPTGRVAGPADPGPRRAP